MRASRLSTGPRSLQRDGPWRAAIVGCGSIAGLHDEPEPVTHVRSHAKAYWLEPSTTLTAVVDTNPRRVEAFSTRWGEPAVYGDAVRMVAEESPDIVSICTPDETHLDVLEQCLDSPALKAVWCEKPLGLDVARAEKIVRAYRERHIVLAVNYQRRWDPLMGRLKQALRGGELGRLQKIVVYYGKGLFHNGSHAIDLLVDWLGRPAEVEVHGWHVDYLPADPTIDARLLFGDIPVYLIGVDEQAYSLFEIEILATMGRVRVASFGREIQWYGVRPDPRFRGYRMLQLRETWERGDEDRAMGEALSDIVDGIRSPRCPRSNGESALATLEVCDRLVVRARTIGLGRCGTARG